MGQRLFSYGKNSYFWETVPNPSGQTSRLDKVVTFINQKSK